MKTLGIIPARFASSRLPGKPLAEINGKPMIEWVYRAAYAAVDELIVATDDQRIADAVDQFGGRALLTSPHHPSGTDRCLEAYRMWSAQGQMADVIVNIQGDEPQIAPEAIRQLTALFSESAVELGTLVKAVNSEQELNNTTGCFAVISRDHYALYFSRALLPVLRDYPRDGWLGKHTFYKHLGMYAYRPGALARFAQMEPSPLEQAEQLEQNRWLENDRRIKVAITEHESLSVDTPEDLEVVRQILQT